MLYTRRGDIGTSGLFETAKRRPKNSAVFEALGALDELNSLLGVCYALALRDGSDDALEIASHLQVAQQHLFIVQAELAGANKQITHKHVHTLETIIDTLERKGVHPHSFVLPGSTLLCAYLDLTRSVSRRVERRVVAVGRIQRLSDASYAYCNRLSSLLYALARYSAHVQGKIEPAPSY